LRELENNVFNLPLFLRLCKEIKMDMAFASCRSCLKLLTVAIAAATPNMKIYVPKATRIILYISILLSPMLLKSDENESRSKLNI
jgi:hypothetical protein